MTVPTAEMSTSGWARFVPFSSVSLMKESCTALALSNRHYVMDGSMTKPVGGVVPTSISRYYTAL